MKIVDAGYIQKKYYKENVSFYSKSIDRAVNSKLLFTIYNLSSISEYNISIYLSTLLQSSSNYIRRWVYVLFLIIPLSNMADPRNLVCVVYCP